MTRMPSDAATMALITLWIGFLEWGSRRLLSNFAARKLCHAGCGMGFMLLDAAKPECRSFVWAVAASSVARSACFVDSLRKLTSAERSAARERWRGIHEQVLKCA